MKLKRLVVGPYATNAYILACEETGQALVVDPGAQPERILQALKEEGLTLSLIVSTHGHSDHTGGVARLKEETGAPYALHPQDIPYLKDSRAREWMPDFQEPPGPDLQLKGGDTLRVGSVSLLVLETPGHTPGSVCLYTPGLVFTGDTLFQGSVGRTDFPGGSHARLLLSITGHLLVLPDDTVVLPGHGPRTTIGRERRTNPFLVGAGGGFMDLL